MKIYYAHCVAIYNTPQEDRDMQALRMIFPDAEIHNPNNPEDSKGYQEKGMQHFYSLLAEDFDLFVFRALPGGQIPAGVAGEINAAITYGIPIMELPSFMGRELSVADTRHYLKEIGSR